MLTFAPMSRADGYVTLSFDELMDRAIDRNLGERVSAAVASGGLTAFVQIKGDPLFYRVPLPHWNRTIKSAEGEPRGTLFCWGSSDVPVEFHDRPLIFFLDNVEAWEAAMQVEAIAREMEATASALCKYDGSKVREGFWSPYATLAWIAGRSDEFVAAAQRFEVEHYANRGSSFSSAAWLMLGDEAAKRFGMNFSIAEELLREALEAGSLEGGAATNVRTGEHDLIELHKWPTWSRTFETSGLMLLPGYVNFLWPSAKVRSAFPRSSDTAQPPVIVQREKVTRPDKQEVERLFAQRVKDAPDGGYSREEDEKYVKSLGVGDPRGRARELRRMFPGRDRGRPRKTGS